MKHLCISTGRNIRSDEDEPPAGDAPRKGALKNLPGFSLLRIQSKNTKSTVSSSGIISEYLCAMLDRRLSDLISALREAALDLPPGLELTAVLEQLRKATDEENQRVWNRLQQGLPDRRYVANRPSTINSKLATIMAAFRRV